MIEPRAIDWRLPLVLGALIVLDQIAALGAIGLTPRSTAPLLPRLAAGLLTVTALTSVLAVGRWTWLRTTFARRHPSVAVLSVALSVQVGLAVSDRVLTGRGVLEPQVGLPGGEFVFLVATTLVVLVFLSALSRHRDLMADITRTTERLSAAHEASRTGVVAERERLNAHVRELLEERLGPTSMRASLFSPQRLRAVADEALRPLSHQLAGTPADLRIVVPGGRSARVSAVLRAIRPTPVLRPRLLAATMGVLVFRFSVTPPPPELLGTPDGVTPSTGDLTITVQWSSLIESLALHATTVLLVLLGTRRLARWLAQHQAALVARGRPVPARVLTRSWAVTVTTLTALGLASLMLLRIVFELPNLTGLPPVTLGVAIGFVSPLLLITVALSVLRAAEGALEELRERLDATNRDLASAVARANALLDHERRLFARHLHASVQAAVNAASLAIERATVEGTVDPEVVARAGASIDAAVERLLEDPSSIDQPGADGADDLAGRLTAVSATWEGLAELDLQLDAEARDRLARDAVARATLCDLIAEACANAVIHGHATRVVVDVGLDATAEEHALSLRVEDDGRATSPQRRDGLGSRILTTSCTAWELEHREDGTTLTATLPVR